MQKNLDTTKLNFKYNIDQFWNEYKSERKRKNPIQFAKILDCQQQTDHNQHKKKKKKKQKKDSQ